MTSNSMKKICMSKKGNCDGIRIVTVFRKGCCDRTKFRLARVPLAPAFIIE